MLSVYLIIPYGNFDHTVNVLLQGLSLQKRFPMAINK